jgi:hypothetical protein
LDAYVSVLGAFRFVKNLRDITAEFELQRVALGAIIQDAESTKPDLRSTIYWKPNLITDENGQAQIRFYTADLAGTYTLILEGISSEGEILRHVQKIELRK